MSNENGKTALIPLKPVVKDYAWGIRGMDSRVGRYALESKIIEEIDPDTPYAELWIGTHAKGPSTLGDGSNRTLKDAIGEALPFLFTVLSAGKALSIQAHPDKNMAARLNAENPQAYGDANHKPEMAIALTPFEAMCGFRRLEEVALLLKKHPEFAACISEEAKLGVFLADTPDSQKEALQKLFASFMSCDPKRSKMELNKLLSRLQNEQNVVHPHPHDAPAWERKCARAILRLASQFPGDAGAMSPLFLNYLLIAPGESFFMAANEPHAYVAGEIIECMACSDNVVRAGLTPKFKDVDNLVEMLTYTMGGPSIDVGEPEPEDPRIVRYTPPVPEFEVMILTLDPGDNCEMKHPGVPCILVVVEGSGRVDGQDLRPGRSYYWGVAKDEHADASGGASGGSLTFSVDSSRRGPLKLTVAHKNMHIESATTFNRNDSTTNLTGLHGSLPYMGRGSPSPAYLKATISKVTEGTPTIPKL